MISKSAQQNPAEAQEVGQIEKTLLSKTLLGSFSTQFSSRVGLTFQACRNLVTMEIGVAVPFFPSTETIWAN